MKTVLCLRRVFVPARLAWVCCALLMVSPLLQAAPAIPNPSFETDHFANPNSPYVADNTPITGWTVVSADTAYVGLNPNGSGNHDFANNGKTPDGTNIAFIQCRNGHAPTTLSTTITGLTVGVTYQVQFRANARFGGSPSPSYQLNGGQAVPFAVTNVDDVNVFTNPYATISGIFTASDVTAALAISNNTPAADTSLLVDAFTIQVAPQTTIQVTSTNDDGPGSLRQALAAAAGTPAYNRITFAPALNGKTIMLGSEIIINDAVGVTLDASALAAGLTIDGGPGGNRIFTVGNTTATSLALLNLTLTHGHGGSAISNFSGDGGAIFNYSGSTLLIQCSLTANNTSLFAGAIDNHSLLTLHQCTISSNGSNAGAGAIYNDSGSTAIFTQCTLSGNVVSGDGGAIENAGTLALTLCTLSGNVAGREGAGIENQGGTVSLTQCTISNNSSNGSTGGGGGGIVSFESTSAAQLVIDRSIIAGNSATTGAKDINCAGVTLLGTSIIQDISVDGSTAGTGTILKADPKLAPLASNGGPTQTLALLPHSPAIDAATGSTVTMDQRGLPVVVVPDIGAFEVQAGGVFFLDSTSYSVDKTAGHVNVTINRGVAFVGQASVKISTKPGTAGKTNFNSVAQVVIFQDGQTSISYGIDILNDNHADADLTFTVTLSNPSTGASIGSPASATVVILDPSVMQDTTPPGAPVITSPAANASVGVPTGGILTLTGTATDNKGIGGVGIADSTGTFLVAATLSARNAATTAWTAALVPATGHNVFQVVAYDSNGKASPVVSRSFTILRPLVVNISGYGSVTAGYAPSSYRQVGQPQTITATPGAGYLFTGWSILSSQTAAAIGASPLSLPTLSFLQQEGLALRASFVPSPYVAGNTGVFNGGVDPSPSVPAGGTAASLSTVGYATVTVQTSGAFTSALKLDGTSYPVAGVFDVTGTARFGPSRAAVFTIARQSLPGLSVTMNLNLGTGIISGVVSAFDGSTVTASSTITAERCPFSIANLVPPSLLAASNADALYTTIMTPTTNAGLTTAQFPQGAGYASVKLTKTGTITVSGVLADGTPLTSATTLSGAQHWRLFASLYGNKGLVAGNAAFAAGNYDFTALGTLWLRPEMDSQYYPGGWPGGIAINVGGAKYTVPAGASVLPGLDTQGDAEVVFSQAGLASPLSDTFTLSSADIAHNTGNDPSYKVTINRQTGVFSGFFTHSDSSKPVFTGVVLNKSVTTVSAGFFLSQAPTVKDYTGQSGLVVLDATP